MYTSGRSRVAVVLGALAVLAAVGEAQALGGAAPPASRSRSHLPAPIDVIVAGGASVPSRTPAAVAPGSGATLCVGPGSGCYRDIQAAVDAAQDGDTIRIAAGVYAGGVTVNTSVALEGAGAGRTIVSGGGPVLTIGVLNASSQPTVSVRGLAIRDGHTTASFAPFFATGGGVWIPPSAAFSPGASVTIADATITDNATDPAATFVPTTPQQQRGWPRCPGGFCPFGGSFGGGIASWGPLTLRRVVVSANRAGGDNASDADGGGVYSGLGGLTLEDAVVTGNTAIAVPPIGRFAEGGGVFVNDHGSLAVRRARVAHNTVSLTSDLPAFLADGTYVDTLANSGAIHVGDDVPTTVRASALVHNAVLAANPHGQTIAIDAAMIVGASPLDMDGTLVAHNRAWSRTASTGYVGPAGSVLEADGGGAISGSRIVDNAAVVFTPGRVAGVTGGLAVLPATPLLLAVRDTLIARNSAIGRSGGGAAVAQGGGILNNGLLVLEHVDLLANVVRASGTRGVAQGGGVWNGALLAGPPVHLGLQGTRILGNVAAGSHGIDRAGGGIFSDRRVLLGDTELAGNRPDDCSGC